MFNSIIGAYNATKAFLDEKNAQTNNYVYSFFAGASEQPVAVDPAVAIIPTPETALAVVANHTHAVDPVNSSDYHVSATTTLSDGSVEIQYTTKPPLQLTGSQIEENAANVNNSVAEVATFDNATLVEQNTTTASNTSVFANVGTTLLNTFKAGFNLVPDSIKTTFAQDTVCAQPVDLSAEALCVELPEGETTANVADHLIGLLNGGAQDNTVCEFGAGKEAVCQVVEAGKSASDYTWTLAGLGAAGVAAYGLYNKLTGKKNDNSSLQNLELDTETSSEQQETVKPTESSAKPGYGDIFTTSEESKPEESKSEESKPEESKSEESNSEVSKPEVIKHVIFSTSDSSATAKTFAAMSNAERAADIIARHAKSDDSWKDGYNAISNEDKFSILVSLEKNNNFSALYAVRENTVSTMNGNEGQKLISEASSKAAEKNSNVKPR